MYVALGRIKILQVLHSTGYFQYNVIKANVEAVSDYEPLRN